MSDETFTLKLSDYDSASFLRALGLCDVSRLSLGELAFLLELRNNVDAARNSKISIEHELGPACVTWLLKAITTEGVWAHDTNYGVLTVLKPVPKEGMEYLSRQLAQWLIEHTTTPISKELLFLVSRKEKDPPCPKS